MNNVLEFNKRQDRQNKCEFYSTNEVAQLLGCSVATARETMRKKDFPLKKIGKNWKVAKTAFEKWCEQRHA